MLNKRGTNREEIDLFGGDLSFFVGMGSGEGSRSSAFPALWCEFLA